MLPVRRAQFFPAPSRAAKSRRPLGKSDGRIRMSYRPSILIHDEDDRQARVEQLSGTLSRRLLHDFENFLKGNDRHHCRNDLVAVHYRRSNGQSHFLTRPDDLRPTNDYTAGAHAGEHVTDALVDFLSLDQVRLKRAMNFALDRA